MRKCTLCAVLFLTGILNAQWLPVNPGFYLDLDIQPGAIHADENVIMVPTKDDRIFKSFDKGKTWVIDFLRNSHDSYRITGMGPTKISFGGNGVHGMITTNNGGTWKEFNYIFTPGGAVALDAESAREGEFIAIKKEQIRRRTTTSLVWLTVTVPVVTGEFFKDLACFKNSGDYFLLTTNNKIHHTADQGVNFIHRKTFPKTINFIEAINNTHVIAFGTDSIGNVIYRSRNKGETWDSITVPHNFRQLRMFTPAAGFAFDESNTVYHTSDSMKTWQISNAPKLKETAVIKYLEAIGFDGTNRPWFTSDGGANWEPRTDPAYTDIRGLAILSQNEIFMVRRGGKVYRSGNYGYYWQEITDSIPGTVFYITKENDHAFLAHTSDGVFRFQQAPRQITRVNIPVTNANQTIYAYDTNYIACDRTDSVWISTDRGANWSLSILPAARKTNFAFARGRDIYLGQDSGYFMRSNDLGLSWHQKRVSTTAGDNIVGIVGHGDSIFIACTVSRMLFSTDGGVYWSARGFPVRKFFYCESNHWYFFTNIDNISPKIYSTSNFGSTLILDEFQPFSLSDVTYLDSRIRSFGIMLKGTSLMVKYAMGTPVEFTTFSAETVRNGVLLNWSTATETNNHGFFVQKNADGSWRDLAFIPGKGSTVSVNNYSFTDENWPATGEKVLYRLRQVDHSGEMSYSKEIEITGVPVELALGQNYPNPFNPVTVIRYALPARGSAITGFVELKVYNTAGELVKVLVNGEMPAGEHTVEFNASDLPSGIYFYRLDSGNTSLTRKMTLLK